MSPALAGAATEPTVDVGALYEAHADMVWRSLHRLGVATRDLPDLLQEVFVVVHRRRDDFDAGRPVRAWLWGICVGLARNYRRRAFRRAERLTSATPERQDTSGPDDALEARERRQAGRQLLDGLDPEKRAVFVMFEVEGLSGKRIAEELGVPVGTVHSRLHAARRALLQGLSERGSE